MTTTLFIDVLCKGRYVFTLRYKHSRTSYLDVNDVYNAVLKKRPTLKGEHLELYFD